MSRAPTALVVPRDPLEEPVLLAVAGFLGGYSALTRDAYAGDLRQFLSVCASHDLAVLEVCHAHMKVSARVLDAGKGRRTMGRRLRLSTVAGSYCYAGRKPPSTTPRGGARPTGRASTMSPTPSGSRPTSSAPSWSRPALPRCATTPPRFSPSTVCGSRGTRCDVED